MTAATAATSGVFTSEEADRLEVHPLAELSPPMTASEEAELADSIAWYGMHDPIELLDGKILDGRHRRKCASRSGALVPWRTWRPPEPDHPPELWVLAKNAHRRHLGPTQRAILAAEAKRLLDARGARYTKVVGYGEPRPTIERRFPDVDAAGGGIDQRIDGERPLPTVGQIATSFDVSRDSVERGEKVLEYGADELVDAARRNVVGIRTLAAVAELPLDAQRAAVAGGPVALREAARRVEPLRSEDPPPEDLGLQDEDSSPSDTDTDADTDGDGLPNDERAENDAYYTPDATALVICRWLAERIPAPRTILEPAAGGGAWVRAARQVWPDARVDRADIDGDAQGLIEDLRDEERVYHGNFRDLDLEGRAWDLILGNPPYGCEELRDEAGVVLLNAKGKPRRDQSRNLHAWVTRSLQYGRCVAYLLRETYTGSQKRLPWWRGEGRPATICKVLPRQNWGGPGSRDTSDLQDAVEILWCGNPTQTLFDWLDVDTDYQDAP